jgi:hypothetical protein
MSGTLTARIQEIKDWLDAYYGFPVCYEPFVEVYSQGDKIVIAVCRKRYFVRERRRGRGIQAMRVINLIGPRFLGRPGMSDKTVVLGKDTTATTIKHDREEALRP